MKVYVTQEDINKGLRNSRQHCPLALAITRCCGKPTEVGAYCCWSEDFQFGISLPTPAYDFRHKFDINKPVQPFTFDL